MELDDLDRRELLNTVSAAAGLIGERAGSAEPQAEARHRVLVENPAVLYGF